MKKLVIMLVVATLALVATVAVTQSQDNPNNQQAVRLHLTDSNMANEAAFLVTNQADEIGYVRIDANLAGSIVTVERLMVEPKTTLRVIWNTLILPADTQEVVATSESGNNLNIIVPDGPPALSEVDNAGNLIAAKVMEAKLNVGQGLLITMHRILAGGEKRFFYDAVDITDNVQVINEKDNQNVVVSFVPIDLLPVEKPLVGPHELQIQAGDGTMLYKGVLLEELPQKENRKAVVKTAATASNTCPSAGRYCGWELGGSATDKNLFSCSAAGKTPVLFHGCRDYCAGAASNKYSFCATTARMPSADLKLFAKANLAGTELLWADKTVNGVTTLGGNHLSETNKFSQACSDTKNADCTNAGDCVAFAKAEAGVPAASSWAPLTNAQMSIANAPDGTMVATFVNKSYGGTPHTMFKCGGYFCDSNWHTPYDNHVRRRSASTTTGYSVVAIPTSDGY